MSKNSEHKSSPAIGDSSPKVLESIRGELQGLGLRPYAARRVLALLRSGNGHTTVGTGAGADSVQPWTATTGSRVHTQR